LDNLWRITVNNAEFSALYHSAPDGCGGVRLTLRQPIQTRDARTVDPPLPLFSAHDRVALPSPSERGFVGTRDQSPTWRDIREMIRDSVSKHAQLFRRSRGRTVDDTLTGNDPQKRIALGTVWTAESLEPLRDYLTSAIEALEAHRNFVPDVPVGAQDIAKLGEVINLAHTYQALATDALRRAKDAGVEGTSPDDLIVARGAGTPATQLSELQSSRKPSDSPVMRSAYPADAAERPGENEHEAGPCFPSRSEDSARRPMLRNGSQVLGSNRGISTADYAANLKKERAALAAQAQAAPAGKARVTAAEFAKLHDKSALRAREAEG
jgi:hypothetical protein